MRWLFNGSLRQYFSLYWTVERKEMLVYYKNLIMTNFIGKLAIAAMHGPHSVFDHCTVIHCDAEGVSLVDQ